MLYSQASIVATVSLSVTVAVMYSRLAIARRLHRRHDELRSPTNAGRPARGDRLEPRVEPDAFWTVHVVVTKQRGFPPAERMEGHWNRNRNVDPNHSYPYVVRKLSRRGHRLADLRVRCEVDDNRLLFRRRVENR